MGGDTIFALSSAPGRAGVSIVRVSGPRALDSLIKIAALDRPPAPRHAAFLKLTDSVSRSVIDRALVISFAAPSSFTGENVAEYQLHGSPAVVSALLSALSSFADHRMAEPGEFTRRAFENGKLDLTEAEAVADLINAETEQQRIQALAQMDGALSRLYDGWRTRLIKAMAYVETVIDFPDEDIPDSQIATVFPDMQTLKADIEHHLNDGHRGERLRGGIRIAILGAPNAGKSSLINVLCGRQLAIVSPLAGTTRDVIEAHLDIAGYPVIFADTAGLRGVEPEENDSHAAIEGEGIRRALLHAADADLKMLVFDGTSHAPDRRTLDLIDANTILVLTRVDHKDFNAGLLPFFPAGVPAISLSSLTGANIDGLLSLLEGTIKALYAQPREMPYITRARHRDALLDCAGHLERALAAPALEMIAEDLRLAARALGRITGRVDIEDLLDVVFRDFCIGK